MPRDFRMHKDGLLLAAGLLGLLGMVMFVLDIATPYIRPYL